MGQIKEMFRLYKCFIKTIIQTKTVLNIVCYIFYFIWITLLLKNQVSWTSFSDCFFTIILLGENIAAIITAIAPIIGPSVKLNTPFKKNNVIRNITKKIRNENKMALELEFIVLN